MNSRRLMNPKTDDDSLSHRSEAIVRHSNFDRSTSGLGHQRCFERDLRTSGLPPRSDILLRRTKRREGQERKYRAKVLASHRNRDLGLIYSDACIRCDTLRSIKLLRDLANDVP
jgi:hypothetical protein